MGKCDYKGIKDRSKKRREKTPGKRLNLASTEKRYRFSQHKGGRPLTMESRKDYLTMGKREKAEARKKARPDQAGTHRLMYESNRKKILARYDVCGICGNPVDKKLKRPHPLSPVVDHIVPIALGGHPSDIDNLQLAHFTCNAQKGKTLVPSLKTTKTDGKQATIDNSPENLPWSINWLEYIPNDEANQQRLIEEARDLQKQGKIITARGIIQAGPKA